MNSYDRKQKEGHVEPAASVKAEGTAATGSLLQSGRGEVVAQRQLQQSFDRSPRVQTQLDLGRTLNQSPRAVAQAKLADDFSSRRGAAHARRAAERPEDDDDEKADRDCGSVTQCLAAPAAGRPLPRAGAPAANRTGLPAGLKAGVERLGGVALDDVRVHYNSPKPAQLQALAYTQGSDIHVAAGQERHLPHETWHAAQQKQGRVRASKQLRGVAVNDDSALEREAEVMGARALRAAGRAGDDATTPARAHAGGAAPAQRSAVAQLAAPGAIEHAINSCFVAALINIFTVTRSLKNLLISDNNDLSADPNADVLQDLLLRAVNTVDLNDEVVPRTWVKNIMVSLRENGIIRSATDTEDVNHVVGAVVERLTAAGPAAGQPNNQPVSSGPVVWDDETSLTTAVASAIQHLQQADNPPGITFPNVIHVNRQIGNPREVPQTFDLYPSVGNVITYRLTAAIKRDAGYVGGHFVSYVDRGDGGGQEWWESNDIGPAVRQVGNIRAVDDAQAEKVEKDARETGASEQKGPEQEKEKQKEQTSAEATKTSTASAKTEGTKQEDSDAGPGNMLSRAVTYIYERTDAQEVEQDGEPLVTELPGETQDVFDEEYLKDYKAMLADEGESVGLDEITLDDLDEKEFDKDLEEAAEEADGAMSSVLAVKLPPVVVGPAQLVEAQRQVRLQLAGLNRMTAKQWVLNAIINRIKTTEQIIRLGKKFKGTETLAARIDTVMAKNDALASMVMDEIVKRMKALASAVDVKELPDVIGKAEAAKKAGKDIYMTFRDLGGLRDMEVISRARMQGGIGRQQGEGDEETFKKEFEVGLLLAKTTVPGIKAVLHNPDQCAGGSMEVLCEEPEVKRLVTARTAYQKLAAGLSAARIKHTAALKELHTVEASTTTFVPPRQLKGATLTSYFTVRKEEAAEINKVSGQIKAEKVAALKAEAEKAEKVVQSMEKALATARQVYKELTLRHVGDSEVNSLLGSNWIEPLDERHGTRVSRILDTVLAQPMETWDKTRMGVAMGVGVNAARKGYVKEKSEKGKEKDLARLHTLETGEKKPRKPTTKKKASTTPTTKKAASKKKRKKTEQEKEQDRLLKKKAKLERDLDRAKSKTKESAIQPSWMDILYQQKKARPDEAEAIALDESDEGSYEAASDYEEEGEASQDEEYEGQEQEFEEDVDEEQDEDDEESRHSELSD